MLHWLTDPFVLTFMQRALMASLIVGVLCSVLGCYVVLRSMAFLGDALAHAILPGVAIAYLVGGNLLVGAVVAALLVAFGVSFFTHEGTLKEDTAIGILFSAALSLGVVLISTIQTYATDLTHILFGNVLGVSRADLIITGGLAAVVLATVLALYKELLLVTFDPVLAHMLRRRPGLMRTLLLVLLALTVVVSLQTVGVGSGGRHAGDPRRDRVPAHPASVRHDAGGGGRRSGGERRRPVPELLPQRGLRSRRRADRHRFLRARLPVRAAPGTDRPLGAAWTRAGGGRRGRDGVSALAGRRLPG